MAAADVIQRIRSHIYGVGLGEGPTLIQGAADAAESITNNVITFNVATGEGDKIKAGNKLSVHGAATADDAYVMYVFGVSTDTVTALMGYEGSPSPNQADDLDGLIFEIGYLKSEWLMWQKAETVADTLLWPDVVKYVSYDITPDLSDGQVELNANVMGIEGAYQQIGDEEVPVAYAFERNLGTSVSSTGVLGFLDAIDGSAVTVKTIQKITLDDTLDPAVEECIATGAAALVLGASASSTALEASSKNSQMRAQASPADKLWRDFVTLRTALLDEQASQVDFFEIRR